MTVRRIALGLLACALPLSASAQEGERATVEPRSFGAAVLLGSTTYRDPLHGVLGARAGAEWSGWGVLGLASVGGGGYDSRMLAAAATRRLVGGDGWSLGVLAGGGHYAEDGPTGIERSAPGVLYGLDARRRAGPLTLYLMVTDFRGRYDGDDVSASFGFSVPRVHLGVGY